MFDLGLIHINRLIVHEVPRRFLRAESTGNGPVLSDVVSPLQNDVRNFFQERLVSTLSAAYDVEFDPSAQSTVPQVVEGLLREPPIEFVAASRDLANLLHASQGGVNPAGLLTLMDLTIGERAGLAIVKLEKEEGARVQHSRAGGHSTFNVSHLRDLMLTKKTKVFKVGLFARNHSRLQRQENRSRTVDVTVGELSDGSIEAHDNVVVLDHVHLAGMAA